MDDGKETETKRNEKGRFLEGTAPGPGRPEGSVSIIGEIKKIWRENPERFKQYVEDVLDDKNLRKELVQQIDGKPVQPLANADGQPFIMHIIQYASDTPEQAS